MWFIDMGVRVREGVTQGDPLEMILYGMIVITLSKYLKHHVLDA